MENSNTNQSNINHFVPHLIQGFIFIVIGVLTILVPKFAIMSFELILGALFVTAAILAAVTNFKSRNSWWIYIPSALTLLIGAIMLFRPLVGLVALSLFICIFLVCKGITEIILAFNYRHLKNWVWLLASGVIALSLAFIAGVGFPELGIFFLAIIVGVNMISYGAAMLALAWGEK